MSLELVILLREGPLPARSVWQSAIDKMRLDVQLDPELDLARDRGFSPTTIRGRASGFEVEVLDARTLRRDHPQLAAMGEKRSRAVLLRWGGDFAECACVMATAAAALAAGFGLATYCPAEDDTYDVDRLVGDFQACLAEL